MLMSVADFLVSNVFSPVDAPVLYLHGRILVWLWNCRIILLLCTVDCGVPIARKHSIRAQRIGGQVRSASCVGVLDARLAKNSPQQPEMRKVIRQERIKLLRPVCLRIYRKLRNIKPVICIN